VVSDKRFRFGVLVGESCYGSAGHHSHGSLRAGMVSDSCLLRFYYSGGADSGAAGHHSHHCAGAGLVSGSEKDCRTRRSQTMLQHNAALTCLDGAPGTKAGHDQVAAACCS
jgi:hypothetical protein